MPEFMVHLAAAVIAVVRLAGGGDRSESSAARPRNGARIRRERSFLSGVGGREVDRIFDGPLPAVSTPEF